MDIVWLRAPTKWICDVSLFTVSNSVRSIPSAKNAKTASSWSTSQFVYVFNRDTGILQAVFPLYDDSLAVSFLFMSIYFIRLIYIYYLF
jgi:hypothetical protein